MAHLKVRLDTKDLLKLFDEHPDFEVRLLGNLSKILSDNCINDIKKDIIECIINNYLINYINDIKNEITSIIKNKLEEILNDVIDKDFGKFFIFDKNTNKLDFTILSYEQLDAIKVKIKRVLNVYYDNIINDMIKDKLKLIETTDAIDKKVEFFTTSVVSKLIKERFEKEYTAIKNEINNKYNKK